MQTPQPDSGPVSSRSFSRQVMPELGEMLGDRYRLERNVSRTEAGVVFDAADTTTGRRVAIELATSLEDPKARRKWARDAMMAQRLEGEHVLRVLAVGNTPTNVPYVVRETAVSTLAAEVDARGAVPLPQAVGWTLEACEAVAEAHAVGMAHGDLRLDNVYLARGAAEPSVKVAWTSAAKAERAAKEDVQRDIAGLGAMLRVLATGQMDVEAEGAPTLPTDVAHAVSRALAQDSEGTFHNVSELARVLAPYAPPGHGSARTVAFLLSRAGIVGGAIPHGERAKDAPESGPRSSRRRSAAQLGPIGPTAQAGTDRASFTDEWFGRASRTSLTGQLAAAPSPRRGVAFAVVSVLLLSAVLGGTWLLFANGKLPRWTGAAPPEEVGTTQVTSAPDDDEEGARAAAEAREKGAQEAIDRANAAAAEEAAAKEKAAAEAARTKAAAAKATPAEALPNAPAASPVTAAPATAAPAPTTPAVTTPAAEPTSRVKSELRYAEPSDTVPATIAPHDSAPITTTPAPTATHESQAPSLPSTPPADTPPPSDTPPASDTRSL